MPTGKVATTDAHGGIDFLKQTWIFGATKASVDNPEVDLETIEAEVVFLIRSAGQWPSDQTEIHLPIERRPQGNCSIDHEALRPEFPRRTTHFIPAQFELTCAVPRI